jgi:HAE1 family hydrophobic/amphiphilic exporter-1
MSFIGVIMLMGLVAKNAILLLDCARKEEAQGRRSRGGADARRARAPAPDPDDHVRADRRHDAGGDRLGEGGEFYRPMAVAIIGGTITSTLLTLPGRADVLRHRSRSRATARSPNSTGARSA